MLPRSFILCIQSLPPGRVERIGRITKLAGYEARVKEDCPRGTRESSSVAKRKHALKKQVKRWYDDDLKRLTC